MKKRLLALVLVWMVISAQLTAGSRTKDWEEASVARYLVASVS